MSQTENMPNFDNMSEDEIMAWMESLAKRQGANEGFTTAADVEIEEIDPDSVVIDEPGYVPYEESLRTPKAAPVSPPPAPPPPMPVIERPVAPPPVSMPLFTSPPPAPLFAPPPAPQAPTMAATAPAEDINLGAAMGDNAMAWLQSLAADQDSSEFSLDLSSLDDELDMARSAPPPAPVQTPAPTAMNPQSWLKSIADEAGDDQDFKPATPRIPAPTPALENPASLLDSLASGAGFFDDAVRAAPELRLEQPTDMTIEGIERAIREGRVTAEQMKRYQELQMERASHIPEPELAEEVEEDAQPADLPDWLEEMNPESAIEAEMQLRRQTGQLAPLESLLETQLPKAQTGALNVPDWLNDEDALSETAASIFDDAPTPVASIEVDDGDPWVEALDQEYEHRGEGDEVPTWYAQNIADPARITRVETSTVAAVSLPVSEPARKVDEMPAVAQIQIVPVQLSEASLPVETNLRAGERQSVPSWMVSTSTGTMVAVSAPEPLAEEFSASTPDWLRSTDEQPPAMLDWQHAPVQEAAAPVITYTPPVAPPPPPTAPIGNGSLQEARTRYREGDVTGSLVVYELLVRTGQALADVAGDLSEMANTTKNPVAYRVLGDSLMRQGKLQDALNIYRQALNML